MKEMKFLQSHHTAVLGRAPDAGPPAGIRAAGVPVRQLREGVVVDGLLEGEQRRHCTHARPHSSKQSVSQSVAGVESKNQNQLGRTEQEMRKGKRGRQHPPSSETSGSGGATRKARPSLSPVSSRRETPSSSLAIVVAR